MMIIKILAQVRYRVGRKIFNEETPQKYFLISFNFGFGFSESLGFSEKAYLFYILDVYNLRNSHITGSVTNISSFPMQW